MNCIIKPTELKVQFAGIEKSAELSFGTNPPTLLSKVQNKDPLPITRQCSYCEVSFMHVEK